jgi:hypothetical protein
MSLLFALWRWLWVPKEQHVCDCCDGTFKLEDMSPTSGDFWLCPKCMDALLEEMKEHDPGKPQDVF